MQARTPYNEKELLLRIADSDEIAFRELFHHYKNRTYSYAMHFTDRVHLAEEIVQDVFMKVWQHREILPGLERFEAWIYTVTRNFSLSYLRKLANEEALKEGWSKSGDVTTDSTDEMLLNKEYQNLLLNAIEQLPPQQKLVYFLSRNDGLKHEEIADKLNISRNTVRVHITNALRTIRAYMRKHLVVLVITASLPLKF